MAGRSQRAIEVLAPADGRDVLGAIPAAWRSLGFAALAAAYAETNRPEEAAQAVAVAEAHAAAVGLPMAIAWTHHAAASVALHRGDFDEAAERALASAAASEEVGVVVEAALARVLAGRALAAGANDDASAEQFERAAETFDRAGADRHRQATEQHLRGLGRRVYRRSRSGTAPDGDGLNSLTAREQEIARLVTDRRTNPEIAAELFLSQKTVETHLRNIFRKVSVTSRVELARAVERADRQT
jgi:DNA-binding NarL/FixJ family response regulator